MAPNVTFTKPIKIMILWTVYQSEKKSKGSFGTNMTAFYMVFITMVITVGAFKAH